jgi:hypothetical protein
MQTTTASSSSGSASESGGPHWNKVEACLFCIEVVVHQMPTAGSPLFPQLMAFIGYIYSFLLFMWLFIFMPYWL